MRKALILSALILLSCGVSSNIGADLSNRVRAAAPQHQPTLGNFISGINTQVWTDQATIQTSQVDSFVNTARHYGVGGRGFDFRPFGDLTNLKFGTNYHKIHQENSINIPGFCFTKATAVIGHRSGSTITYKAGYGVTVGNGVQQFAVTKVHKCKKRFFRKKCWWEDVRVPRGLHPDEFRTVLQGLENTLYNAIAARVAGRRLLRQVTDQSVQSEQIHDMFQSIGGVQESQLFDAIYSLVGEQVAVEKSAVLRGEEVAVTTSNGQKHLIKVSSGADSSVEVKVWTTNA